MELISLGNIANFVNGYAFKPSDWGDKGLKIIRIQNLTDQNKPYNKTSKSIPEKYLINKGDLLISWSATLGVFEWDNEESALLNQHIFKTELNEKLVDKNYFRYVLKHTIDEMSQFTHGSTMKHIVRGDFLKHKIPVPSLDEQKKIIELLDQADALIQKRKQAIELIDEYLKSVFLDMFGDPIVNPKGLDIQKLEYLTSKITDGTHKTPKYKSSGIKFISAKNIKKEEITWSDIKYISQEEHSEIYKRCNPEKDDLLLTKSGSLGMVALVDVDFEFSLFESLALLKIKNDLIEPIYLREYLNLKEIKSLYSDRTKGVGVKHLHLIDIKSIPVMLPPLNDQRVFTRRVEEIKHVRQKMLLQSVELENQFRALMQKSFL